MNVLAWYWLVATLNRTECKRMLWCIEAALLLFLGYNMHFVAGLYHYHLFYPPTSLYSVLQGAIGHSHNKTSCLQFLGTFNSAWSFQCMKDLSWRYNFYSPWWQWPAWRWREDCRDGKLYRCCVYRQYCTSSLRRPSPVHCHSEWYALSSSEPNRDLWSRLQSFGVLHHGLHFSRHWYRSFCSSVDDIRRVELVLYPAVELCSCLSWSKQCQPMARTHWIQVGLTGQVSPVGKTYLCRCLPVRAVKSWWRRTFLRVIDISSYGNGNGAPEQYCPCIVLTLFILFYLII